MPTTYAIPNGRTVFGNTTWTGDGAGAKAISNSGFKPDLVWLKAMGNTASNQLDDSVRGATAGCLYSDLTNAQDSNFPLTSLNSNGFTLGNTASLISQSFYSQNASGTAYVARQWQAGQGTTSTNTNGSITSTVSVNTAAGFSIVTWTGTGSGNTTVGHGLGQIPKFYITKNISSTSDWGAFFPNTFTGTPTQNKFMNLNTTAIAGNASQALPTSTVLNLNGGFENVSGNSYVAYCWTPVDGFSSFGTYTGNASSDGPFVYLGFRPAFVMTKGIDTAVTSWWMIDNAQNPYNQDNNYLFADTTATQQTTGWGDFLSNGFKIRTTYGGTNNNTENYIYIAFAENPFKYANAR